MKLSTLVFAVDWSKEVNPLLTKPFSPDKIRCSFANVLRYRKEREDAVLNQKYLDTLIDNLPDLIWFKDARGSHLKVNHSFCQAVNKTKSQIEGRGHYYVWDLDPDEYANGEYVCLESEEIVLNKKETCLFDETRFQVQSATPSPWVLASSKKTS